MIREILCPVDSSRFRISDVVNVVHMTYQTVISLSFGREFSSAVPFETLQLEKFP